MKTMSTSERWISHPISLSQFFSFIKFSIFWIINHYSIYFPLSGIFLISVIKVISSSWEEWGKHLSVNWGNNIKVGIRKVKHVINYVQTCLLLKQWQWRKSKHISWGSAWRGTTWRRTVCVNRERRHSYDGSSVRNFNKLSQAIMHCWWGFCPTRSHADYSQISTQRSSLIINWLAW